MTIETKTHNGRKLYIVSIGAKCFGYLNVEKALTAIAQALQGATPDAGLADTCSIAGWDL